MPKSGKDARSERNRIRAHYEQKFSGKLKEKQEAIDGLLAENRQLHGRIKALEGRLEEIPRLENLIQELRQAAGLSPEELEKFRADLGAKARIAKHQADIKRALNALSGSDPYGAMGLLPGVLIGLLSAIGNGPGDEKEDHDAPL